MRVIIAGSQSFTDTARVLDLACSTDIEITEVVCGCAPRGVDACVLLKPWAASVRKMPAPWGSFGRSAGYVRNGDMAVYADALIAIWDGKSPGTRSMINLMIGLEKPYRVIRV